jgi:hypothetical protein
MLVALSSTTRRTMPPKKAHAASSPAQTSSTVCMNQGSVSSLLVEAAPLGRADVAHHRLPVRAALAPDGAHALPRLPVAEDFSNIDHAPLPKAHRRLPTAARTVVESHLALLSVVEIRSAERRVGWPHDPGD